MKKIERKWPIGTADNEVVIKESDLDELEQQRDEAVEALIKECIFLEKLNAHCYTNGNEMVKQRFHTMIVVIEKVYGKLWEEIKAGKR